MDIAKIGRYIAEKRKRARLTQRQLADKLGRSDNTYNHSLYLDNPRKYPVSVTYLIHFYHKPKPLTPALFQNLSDIYGLCLSPIFHNIPDLQHHLKLDFLLCISYSYLPQLDLQKIFQN